MQPDVKKCLFDIFDAGKSIVEYTSGFAYLDFLDSSLVQAAVERKFEIIGEALNRIERLDQTVLDGISEHQRIIGFRNIIAHGYDAIDTEMVWDAVENHLPRLMDEVQKLLDA